MSDLFHAATPAVARRRAFLAAFVAGAVASASGGAAWVLWPEVATTGRAFSALVAQRPDGTVEFVCPAQDIVQGRPQALAMILADEMGAALERIRILPASRDALRNRTAATVTMISTGMPRSISDGFGAKRNGSTKLIAPSAAKLVGSGGSGLDRRSRAGSRSRSPVASGRAIGAGN